MRQGKLVERVEAGSIAEELGIAGGDYVIAINGAEPADILDWQLAESDEELILTIQHQDGELVEYEIEKIMMKRWALFLLPPRWTGCVFVKTAAFSALWIRCRRSCAKLYTSKMMIIACLF